MSFWALLVKRLLKKPLELATRLLDAKSMFGKVYTTATLHSRHGGFQASKGSIDTFRRRIEEDVYLS